MRAGVLDALARTSRSGATGRRRPGRVFRFLPLLLAIALGGALWLPGTQTAHAAVFEPPDAQGEITPGQARLLGPEPPDAPPALEMPAAVVRTDIVEHTVQPGDTLYGIAAQYGLSVETLVWANDLDANPDLLSLGQTLQILPVDGVLHLVQPGETLIGIAATFQADVEAIRLFPANHLTQEGAMLQAGQSLIVPGGVKPKPTPPPAPVPPPQPAPTPPEPAPVPPEDGSAEPDAAPPATDQAPNPAPEPAPAPAPEAPPPPPAAQFIWPVQGRVAQGFRPGHRAIDILAPQGSPTVASAAGTVIVAGWANDGYGNYVVIDHGNGFATLYAHFSRIDVQVGQTVQQGDLIGGVGDTGRATAMHVHFEVHQGGVRLNPADFLH